MNRAEQASMNRSMQQEFDANRQQLSRVFGEVKSGTDEIVDALRRLQLDSNIRDTGGPSAAPSPNSDQLNVIQAMLEQILNAAKKVAHEDHILKRLEFDGMHQRELAIEREHKQTFQWLLYDGSEIRQSSDSHDPFDSSSPSDASSIYASSPVHGPTIVTTTTLEQSATGDDDNGSQSSGSSRDSWEVARLASEEAKRSTTRQLFRNWLTSGNGIFYVSGKAGSGKSTLMKFLTNDTRTKEELESWAGDKTLVFARFFFWNPGTKLQKSLEGLYRAILWEILKAYPEIIHEVFPAEVSSDQSRERLASSPFEFSALESAFGLLARNKTIFETHMICFFIDGLDEYDGDHWKLAKSLHKWSRSSSLKICVSSRPHNEFERSFTNPNQLLRLQELTRSDMEKFVQDEFFGDERFLDAREKDDGYCQLIRNIVDRADGVFLWVRLVTRDLLSGIGNSYSVAELQQRLDSMPEGLRALFESMFASIPRADFKSIARTILVMTMDYGLNHNTAVHAAIDSFFDGSYDVKQLLSGKLSTPLPTAKDTPRWISDFEQRVVARSKGLIQPDDSHSLPWQTSRKCIGFHISSLQFIHRTVFEFLVQDDIQADLVEATKDFDLDEYIPRAYLRMFKELVITEIRVNKSLRIAYFSHVILEIVGPFVEFYSMRPISSLDGSQTKDQFKALLGLMKEFSVAILSLPADDTPVNVDWGRHSFAFDLRLGWYIVIDIFLGQSSLSHFIRCPERLLLTLCIVMKVPELCRLRQSSLSSAKFTNADRAALLICVCIVTVCWKNSGNTRHWEVDGVRNIQLSTRLTSLLRYLLEHGASPNDPVPPDLLSFESDEWNSEPWSAWYFFLFLTFVTLCPHEPRRRAIDVRFEILETFLRHGAHPDIVFVGRLRADATEPGAASNQTSVPPLTPHSQRGSPEASATPSRTEEAAGLVYFHLHHLVMAYQPQNQAEILTLVENSVDNQVEDRGWDLDGWVLGLFGGKAAKQRKQRETRKQQLALPKAKKIEAPDEILKAMVKMDKLAIFDGDEAFSKLEAISRGCDVGMVPLPFETNNRTRLVKLCV